MNIHPVKLAIKLLILLCRNIEALNFTAINQL